MDKAIEIAGLSFSYGKRRVLEGIDLSVGRGEFWGLLGPNGAGKSTLLQIISGWLRPQRGEVRLFSHPLDAWSRVELARRLALIPQKFEVGFPFTVEQLVMFGRHPHRRSLFFDGEEDLRLVRQCLEDTGTSDLADRSWHNLSGGEQKRVMVARALAQQPQVLLMDEPAAHLDIRQQVALLKMIDDIRRREGLTVLAVMHDLNLAAAFCGRLALLKQGRVVVNGSLEEVMTYRHLREVFETDIYVGVNEITGHRIFVPMVAADKPGCSTE
jgi:iron complex transport system ATP-binding protein